MKYEVIPPRKKLRVTLPPLPKEEPARQCSVCERWKDDWSFLATVADARTLGLTEHICMTCLHVVRRSYLASPTYSHIDAIALHHFDAALTHLQRGIAYAKRRAHAHSL